MAEEICNSYSLADVHYSARGLGRQSVPCNVPCVLPPVLSPVPPRSSLRASLAVALLLTHPAASICRKEGLLPPQHCRQGWQFSSNHLTSLQRPRTLRFCVCSFAQHADLPLFCPVTPCLSGIQLRHSCSWPSSPTQELLGPCQPTGHGADPSLIQCMVISISSRGT